MFLSEIAGSSDGFSRTFADASQRRQLRPRRARADLDGPGGLMNASDALASKLAPYRERPGVKAALLISHDGFLVAAVGRRRRRYRSRRRPPRRRDRHRRPPGRRARPARDAPDHGRARRAQHRARALQRRAAALPHRHARSHQPRVPPARRPGLSAARTEPRLVLSRRRAGDGLSRTLDAKERGPHGRRRREARRAGAGRDSSARSATTSCPAGSAPSPEPDIPTPRSCSSRCIRRPKRRPPTSPPEPPCSASSRS